MDRLEPFLHLKKTFETVDLASLIRETQAANPWFSVENVQLAIRAIMEKMLRSEKLEAWLEKYPYPADFQPKNVGIVMAGNIPLVGFFDLLCVCASGHRAHVKMSSKDLVLMQFVVDTLQKWEHPPVIVPLTDSSRLDAVIATGSDNTSRYFRERYGTIPHLIRGSRASIAVLTGDESEADLQGLSDDVFDHFGMGCRSVARFFVPENYDLKKLVNALEVKDISHSSYLNAYRRNNAILKIRRLPYIDGPFFTLRKSSEFSESLSDLIYTTYTELDEVKEWIRLNDRKLQCFVTTCLDHPRRVDFGQAQWPELSDCPDGQDVMDFLNKI